MRPSLPLFKFEEMLVDERTREKIAKLSPIMRAAAEALLGATERILDGDCNEEAIFQAVATLDANSQGRYNDDDLLTYDKAMKILGIGDRGHLKRVLDRYGVEQVTMHNQKVGVPRGRVLAVKDQIKNNK